MTAEQSSVLSFVHDRSELLVREPVLIGTTRWVASGAGVQIFLAWRWALITLDVVCIESPLDVESNLFVIGEDPVAKRRRLNYTNIVLAFVLVYWAVAIWLEAR